MWALFGHATGDLLTLHGRPLVHDDLAELEYLIDTRTTRIVRVTPADLRARSPLEPMMLRDHPGLSHLRWPLRREDFRS